MKTLPLLVLLTAPAWAADAVPSNTICAYPEAALASKATGTTLVGFKPMSDGSLHNAAVRRSSGNADLDKAAVACVSAWRFDPKSDNDLTWVESKGADIYWHLDGPDGKAAGTRRGKPHNCAWAYPAEARDRKLAGTTALRFIITDDGHVRGAKLASSSGSPELDNAALKCVQHWHYLPAVKDDKNIEVPWYAEIPWTPDDALVVVEGDTETAPKPAPTP